MVSPSSQISHGSANVGSPSFDLGSLQVVDVLPHLFYPTFLGGFDPFDVQILAAQFGAP